MSTSTYLVIVGDIVQAHLDVPPVRNARNALGDLFGIACLGRIEDRELARLVVRRLWHDVAQALRRGHDKKTST